MKKFLAIVMAAAMMLSCVAALAEAPDYGENVHLDGTMPIISGETGLEQMTMVIDRDATYVLDDINDNETVALMNEETGVLWNWVVIPTTSANEKVNLMLASWDLPDVFYNSITYTMVAQYMDQEIFMPTEDLVENYMPLTKAHFEQHPEYKAEATAPDGHMYGFPWVEEMYGLVETSGPLFINQNWLDKVGKEMPTTMDELIDVLYAFKEAGDLNGNGVADEYAIGTSLINDGAYDSYNLFHHFVSFFGSTDCANDQPTDHLRIEDGKVVFTANTDAWRKTAELFHTFYADGLINPDTFSVHPNGNTWSAYYADNLADEVAHYGLSSCWSPSNMITHTDVFEEYAALPPITSDEGMLGLRLNLSQMQTKTTCVLTTECKYPEIAAAWCDHFNVPQISVTANWGAKNVTYFEDENGMLCFNLDENGYLIPTAPWENFSEMRSNTALGRGPWMVLDEYYGTVAEYTYDAVALLEWQRINGKEKLIEEGEKYYLPMVYTTSAEASIIATIQPTIKDIVKAARMDFCMNGVTDEAWNAYCANLEAAGIGQLVSNYQTAYDRYVEALAATAQ